MSVTIPSLTAITGADSAAIPDDLELPLYQASGAPTGRKVTSIRLRKGAQTLENKTLGTGSAVGEAATLLSVFASLLRVGSGNKDLTFLQHGSVTWDPALIAAAASAIQTVTITGAVTTDMALCNARGDHDGLILTCRVTAADTVTLRLNNVTAAGIDLASTVFDVIVLRLA
jgi:hypothetical protein